MKNVVMEKGLNEDDYHPRRLERYKIIEIENGKLLIEKDIK